MEQGKVHHLVTKFAPQWERIRDVLEGSDQVKSKKTLYLPMLSGQTDLEYAAYKQRATFFNMTARVFNSNVGMITRRSPTVNFPDEMSDYDSDTVGFTSFRELFAFSVKELLAIGSVGGLVDIVGDRAVPVMLKAENIAHWSKDANGELSSVTIVESKYDDGVVEKEYRYELNIIDGVYTVTTYVDDKFVHTITPRLSGRTINEIPFIGANLLGLDIAPVKSPILDIVDMNLSHYRTSADYEHGLHFVSIPTPVFSGVTIESKVRLGASEGIVLPNKDAKAYYLEFIGSGLEGLKNALQDKQSQISLFSARLQDTNTKGSEAENTVRLRYAADSASLFDIASSAEQYLSTVYRTIAKWMGIDTSAVEIELNKDFLSTKLTSSELKELTQSYVSGAISYDVYIYNLQRGEMLDPNNPRPEPGKPVVQDNPGVTNTPQADDKLSHGIATA